MAQIQKHYFKQDDDNDQVLLVVDEGGANPNPVALELKSTNVKTYDENHIISPKERRELRAKYVEALFSGISAGNHFEQLAAINNLLMLV